jgi:hypothetical protein
MAAVLAAGADVLGVLPILFFHVVYDPNIEPTRRG